MKSFLAFACLVLALCLPPRLFAGPLPANKPAAYPAWWFERDVIPRLDPNNPAEPDYLTAGIYAPADDYAAANQGQLKNIATKAAAEMNARLPGGAGSSINTMVSAWSATPLPGVTRDDFAAINLGQLKHVAEPFYVRLVDELGYIGQPLSPGATRPWSGIGADDYALANIGQVKNVFSFNPAAMAAAQDDPLAPQLILIPSAEYTGDATATLHARVTPANGATLAGLWLNKQPLTPLQAGDLAPAVALIDGLNSFTLKATDNLGHSRSVTVTIIRDNAPPILSITSPVAGTVIEAGSITLIGSVIDTSAIKSLTVNGVAAYVSGHGFEAAAVPLTVGINTLTATATDILGNVSTSMISVTAQPPPLPPGATVPPEAVSVVATPSEGSAPLLVNFTVQIHAPGTLQQVTYDFEGTHQNLVTTTTLVMQPHL